MNPHSSEHNLENLRNFSIGAIRRRMDAAQPGAPAPFTLEQITHSIEDIYKIAE
ncbi:hypothetical protein [Chamaesiphon minutus]|uniref:hypothetical protein n=1 Tax=Chamaesiphon minutus TaxID=1173032 RepID=UPI000300C224|nr:hypothetical protein [Chamaesiphon minutus]